jgi:phosphoribosyl 1,2-cyclic phosphodiesterase
LPFLYSDKAELDLYSGVAADELRSILEGQMNQPYFPVPFVAAVSKRQYKQVAGECEIGSLRIRPVRLNHPGGATGYRIDSPGGSLIYVSDHEHGKTDIDDRIVQDAAGADIMIYDAHFAPEEYPPFMGWGHSTWLEGAKFADRAGVGRLLLFHHGPSRTDQAARAVDTSSQEIFCHRSRLRTREHRARFRSAFALIAHERGASLSRVLVLA